jgi:cytochrome b561
MTLRNSEHRYGRAAQAFHWLSALLILVMWPLGIVMTRIADDAAARLYPVHVGLGIVVLILTILRLIWLFVDKRPATPDDIPEWRRRAFVWNHRLLYIGLLILTISGISMLLTSGLGLSPAAVTPEAIVDSRPQQSHALLSKLFIALLIMHLGGVLSYQFTKGNTLARMGVPTGNRPG